jgi:hypothetical protein
MLLTLATRAGLQPELKLPEANESVTLFMTVAA